MMLREQNDTKTRPPQQPIANWRASGEMPRPPRTNGINEVPAFQAVGCEFDSRLPLQRINALADIRQSQKNKKGTKPVAFDAFVTLNAAGGSISKDSLHTESFRFTSRAQLEAWLLLNTEASLAW